MFQSCSKSSEGLGRVGGFVLFVSVGGLTMVDEAFLVLAGNGRFVSGVAAVVLLGLSFVTTLLQVHSAFAGVDVRIAPFTEMKTKKIPENENVKDVKLMSPTSKTTKRKSKVASSATELNLQKDDKENGRQTRNIASFKGKEGDAIHKAKAVQMQGIRRSTRTRRAPEIFTP